MEVFDPNQVYDAVVDWITDKDPNNRFGELQVTGISGRVFAKFNNHVRPNRFAKLITEGTNLKVKLGQNPPPHADKRPLRALLMEVPEDEQTRLSNLAQRSQPEQQQTDTVSTLNGLGVTLKFAEARVANGEVQFVTWIALKPIKRGKNVKVNLLTDGQVECDPLKDRVTNDDSETFFNVYIPPPDKPVEFTVILANEDQERSTSYLYEIDVIDDRVEFKKLTADTRKGDADVADKKPQHAIYLRAVKVTDAGLTIRALAQTGVSPYGGEVLFFVNEEPSNGMAEPVNNLGFSEHTFSPAELPKEDSVKVRVQLSGTTIGQDSGPIDLGVLKKAKVDSKQAEVLEVVGRPLGTNQWDLNFGVLGPENQPLANVPIRFEYGSEQEVTVTTDASGEASTTIVVEEDSWGSVRVNSALNEYNIPLAGKEVAPAPVVPRPRTLWQKVNNWIFLVATAILIFLVVSSLVFTVGWTYNWLITPDQVQVTISNQEQKGPWIPPIPGSSVEQASQPTDAKSWIIWGVGWVFFPPTAWFITMIWALFWLILIPACFFDEFISAAEAVWRKTQGLHKIQFKRKPFRLRAEVRRTSEGQLSAAHFLNGEKIEGGLAELLAKSKKGFKQLSMGQIVRLILGLDFAVELAQIILKRFLAR